jgi:hypothetical protein
MHVYPEGAACLAGDLALAATSVEKCDCWIAAWSKHAGKYQLLKSVCIICHALSHDMQVRSVVAFALSSC